MDMTARYRVGLVMNMPGRHLGVQDDLLRAGETEVEYPGPQMVEPDDCMEVLLHHVIPFIGEPGQRIQLLIFGKSVAPSSSDLVRDLWSSPGMEKTRYTAAVFRA
jgi:hypothetical protein